MRKYIFLLLIIPLSQVLCSQNKITLDQCQQYAQENYPLIKQYDLISKSEHYTLSNINKTYLPQVSLNGQAAYQSDVTKLPVDFAALGLPVNIKTMSKDQYKATIDINQVIWDGGTTNAQLKIAKANAQVEKQQTEITLYQIREQVNELYFGLLAIDEQIKMLDLLEEDFKATKLVLQSMFNNGATTQSDLDQIDVELLNISQNRIDQEAMKDSFLKMLSLYVHQDFNKNIILEKPQEILIQHNSINRPELSYYNSKRLAFDSQQEAIDSKIRPHIGLFAQGGYGRPGLNMLEDKFKPFAIGGVKLTWNFGNLYTRTNEKRQVELNKSNIDIQEETFLFNMNLQLTQQQSGMQKLKKQLDKDDEIIMLRTRIKKASESKYKNEVYPINDLIRDINAENRAKQQKALREIQYLQSVYNFQYIQGN